MNMKQLSALFVATLLLLGCATTQPASAKLFAAYSDYKASTDEKNIVQLAGRYFAPSLLGVGEKHADDPDAPPQLLFKNYMAREDSHFERSNQAEGCLTINGFDRDNEPVIISLKYLADRERWLIGEIHVLLVENQGHFSITARCPDEFQERR